MPNLSAPHNASVGSRNRFAGLVVAWLAGVLTLLMSYPTALALNITNVSVVNVTPTGFSIIWSSANPETPGISVFSDAGGVTNLAGKLRVEFYPMHTGDPLATNSYDRRLKQAAIRQKTQVQGQVEVRILGGKPRTTYFYRLQASNAGQTTNYPVSGPLPSVTTAAENSFVVQSRQLVASLPGADPAGTIVTLRTTNTPSVLASVAGDGVPGNQVFFSVTDLIDSLGQTNYLPLGDQEFTVQLGGGSTNAGTQAYTLNFNTDFLVGQGNQLSVGGQFVELLLGTAVQRAGLTSSVPITVIADGLTNLSFSMEMPTNRFTTLSLQRLTPEVGLTTLQFPASNRVSITIGTFGGQVFKGTHQVAALNFTLASNQSSAFLPLTPGPLNLLSANALAVTNSAVRPGRIVVVGQEPLLESQFIGNSRNLVLYGLPWAGYQIQSSTNLARNAWSDFIRLPMTNLMETLTGLDTGGKSIFFRAFQFTSVNSILDAFPDQEMTLYGTPWSAYVVESSPSLIPAQWTVVTRVALTNAFSFLTAVKPSKTLFYRSRILAGDPPSLDAHLAGTNKSLTVFGAPGTNYTLQYSTTLSGVVTWHPLLSYTLTNAFGTLSNPGGSGSNLFFRIKR